VHQQRGRTRWILAAIAVVVLGAFVLLAVNFRPTGSFKASGEVATPAQVQLDVFLLDVDPESYTARLRLRVVDIDQSFLNADGRLSEPVRIAVTSSDGTDDVVFPAGSALGRAEVSIGLSGEESDYPFDVHEANVTINPAIPAVVAGEPTRAYLTAAVRVDADSPGWSMAVDIVGQGTDDVALAITVKREATVKVVTFLILFIGLTLAISALVIGVAVRTSRQPIDSSILGWAAGLIFALLALRFYLPGEPPIGSGIDVYGYLWVIVFAFLGMALLVWAWLQRPHPSE
jgi:hypothetical protein